MTLAMQLKVNSVLYDQTIIYSQSAKQPKAMYDGMQFIVKNKIWDLVLLPKESKSIRSKRVFKIKHNSKGNIKYFNARLVA